ncbi:4771_t:CDS:2 [Acaulospora morrowiae]|uniref:4771_t:CDS:1 n=1 Tax=Acaulospora morrowiae TaxID=94023 RepID=A0A9N8V9B5_9GLOM|nr:4771_t:CDS:2 [Acaulospora morrowiae]
MSDPTKDNDSSRHKVTFGNSSSNFGNFIVITTMDRFFGVKDDQEQLHHVDPFSKVPQLDLRVSFLKKRKIQVGYLLHKDVINVETRLCIIMLSSLQDFLNNEVLQVICFDSRV